MSDPENGSLDSELRSRRPRPSRRFGDSLRLRLLAAEARARRPDHLWLLIAAYALCGAVLLIGAAIGA